ncbi:MAG: alkaline phosphatase family protein [Chloroflexi bacterium]|nr:alkaline phosphatase family protein [Chloroflexota bacterium]
MSDAETLDSLFQSGRLLHPGKGSTSIVDFARDLHRLAGCERNDPVESRHDHGTTVLKDLAYPKHLLFLLVDGLGMNFVEGMGRDAFIPRYVVGEMRTVFPSTTPTALTSLATGKWPAEHAVMGWHTMLPEINAVSTIIRYQRYPDEVPLSRLGVKPKQAYPVPSLMPSGRSNGRGGGKGGRRTLYLVPEDIAGSVYSQYWSAGEVSRGYKSLDGAVNMVIRNIASASGPTFTYLYMPQVDRAAHDNGTRHEETLSALDQVDKAVERLASSLPGDASLIITADHGHLDAGPDEQHKLEPNDALLSLCLGPPSGDIRLMYVNVRDENIQKFRELVSTRYDEDFLVLTTDEAVEMDLFGPGALSPEARSRVGNLMVISTGRAVLDYRTALGLKAEGKATKRSHHSGLTPEEMRVPLLII